MTLGHAKKTRQRIIY